MPRVTFPRPQACQRRPESVTALQWQPGDLGAAGTMVGWLMHDGVDFRHPSGAGETTTLMIRQDSSGPVLVHPGWWVIRQERDGKATYSTLDPKDFIAEYGTTGMPRG